MAFIIKIMLIVLMIFIFISLGSALFFLVKDKGHSNRMVKALTWRIGLSIFLMLIILLAFAFGWISPHPI